MKKTIVTLLALAGVATATEYNLIDTSIFTLCGSDDDVEDSDGIAPADVYAYDLNTWHCTYQNEHLTGQSTVTENGLSLQLGNAAEPNKGNAAAVKIEAEAPTTLSFTVSRSTPWGNDSSALAVDYICSLYGFSSDGSPTLLSSWTKNFKRSNISDYAGESVSLNFGENANYASYGVIFNNEKTTAAAGGVNLQFTDIKLSATSLTVPEPTTATLSLLALAGLAARRRRK